LYYDVAFPQGTAQKSAAAVSDAGRRLDQAVAVISLVGSAESMKYAVQLREAHVSWQREFQTYALAFQSATPETQNGDLGHDRLVTEQRNKLDDVAVEESSASARFLHQARVDLGTDPH
jgi:hypothetical protein